MNFMISHFSQVPIYEQLENQISQNILSGSLAPEDMMPSIRSMARELNIGIVTVKRAYDDLCAEGLLMSIQGRGVFVNHIDAAWAHRVHIERLSRMLKDVKNFCDTSAITKQELLDEIHRICEEENNE